MFVSPAPCYTAANLSALYRQAALREKDRAADLLEIGDVCEELAKDLIGIGQQETRRDSFIGRSTRFHMSIFDWSSRLHTKFLIITLILKIEMASINPAKKNDIVRLGKKSDQKVGVTFGYIIKLN